MLVEFALRKRLSEQHEGSKQLRPMVREVEETLKKPLHYDNIFMEYFMRSRIGRVATFCSNQYNITQLNSCYIIFSSELVKTLQTRVTPLAKEHVEMGKHTWTVEHDYIQRQISNWLPQQR